MLNVIGPMWPLVIHVDHMCPRYSGSVSAAFTHYRIDKTPLVLVIAPVLARVLLHVLLLDRVLLMQRLLPVSK